MISITEVGDYMILSKAGRSQQESPRLLVLIFLKAIFLFILSPYTTENKQSFILYTEIDCFENIVYLEIRKYRSFFVSN